MVKRDEEAKSQLVWAESGAPVPTVEAFLAGPPINLTGAPAASDGILEYAVHLVAGMGSTGTAVGDSLVNIAMKQLSALSALTDEGLKSAGTKKVFHRRRILRWAAQLGTNRGVFPTGI
jgi:hypothetical protein